MIKLSGAIALLREADVLIERDTVVSPQLLASATGALALLAQQVRDFTDHVGRKVRAVSTGAYETTKADTTTADLLDQINRDVESARRCFQSAHVHFVDASNTLQDLKRIGVPSS